MEGAMRFSVVIVSALFVFSLLSGISLAGKKVKVVVIPIGGEEPTGDAVEGDVLEGKTFSNNEGTGRVGTMANNGVGGTVMPTASAKAGQYVL